MDCDISTNNVFVRHNQVFLFKRTQILCLKSHILCIRVLVYLCLGISNKIHFEAFDCLFADLKFSKIEGKLKKMSA